MRLASTLGTLALLATTALAACGSDAPGTEPGGGTGTLLVNANASFEGGNSDLEVRVRRADVDVTDAVVTMESNLGKVTLTYNGSGVYTGVQAGWGAWYRLEVEAGADHLHGGIEAPELMALTAPEPAKALDPHAEADGIVTLRWSGELAQTIRVKTKDFEYDGEDLGQVDVPAALFVEDTQELELRRRNRVDLAGGVVGSTLSASCSDKTDLIVVNPF